MYLVVNSAMFYALPFVLESAPQSASNSDEAIHLTYLVSSTTGALAGTTALPGDKSISHRSLLLGALAIGETVVHGLLEGEDVLNTANAIRKLGAQAERDEAACQAALTALRLSRLVAKASWPKTRWM